MRIQIKVIITLLLVFGKSYAQQDTIRVLFVGNSYTYYSNLPKMVSELSKNTSTFIQTEMSAKGGARLKQHYNQEGVLKTKKLIKNKKFDIVVIQEQSMGALTSKKEFLLYSKKLSNYIKSYNAIPYFFQLGLEKKHPKHKTT